MNFVRKIISRWPVNGVVLCHVNDINFKMLCKEDEPIANGSFYWGFTKLSLLELTIFSRVCQRSLNIADIGANVGLYSIIGALSNPKAKITAFEPGIENYNRLQHNVELNGIRNISVENVALSDTTGDLAFNESEDGGISVFSSAKREQVELFTENVKQRLVESITLDDWCKRVKEQFDLIKIDVELFEY
ncbi:MAG: FkbM family methyltransferase [Fulvivirga sp.]|uniref:FkbM family methyltransferase n=1 Tax=Fulvivirga sp. TaxID=1931237 RepID=UPI0032EE3747